MHLAAYVARRVFFSELNESIAFIRPIVPIESRSSFREEPDEYFLTMCATRRRLCSISVFLAEASPSNFLSKRFFSSADESGFGKEAAPQSVQVKRRENNIITLYLLKNFINNYMHQYLKCACPKVYILH